MKLDRKFFFYFKKNYVGDMKLITSGACEVDIIFFSFFFKRTETMYWMYDDVTVLILILNCWCNNIIVHSVLQCYMPLNCRSLYSIPPFTSINHSFSFINYRNKEFNHRVNALSSGILKQQFNTKHVYMQWYYTIIIH